MARRDRYKIITDLFTTGEVVLPGEGSPPVWLQKLNGFETEEARAHANARRALVVRALRETDSDARATVENAAAAMSHDALVEGVVAARYGRHMAEAANALAADPEWHEKQQVLDRIDPLASDLEDDQRKLLQDYNGEYFRRIREGIEARDSEARDECKAMDVAELRQLYIDAFIDQRGQAVFTKESRVAEIVIGARMCDAVPDENDTYVDADHSACKHEPLYIDDVIVDEAGEPVLRRDGEPLISTAYDQVRALPDVLFGTYTQAFDRLNVARHTAKGSASRQSSSASSRPPSEGEASAPSTQEEAPTRPDTT